MRRCLPHVLAILTAFSTVLAGVPSFAAVRPCDPDDGLCITAAPCDADRDSLGETLEEERKLEEEQEETDSELVLFAGPLSGPAADSPPGAAAGAEAASPASISTGIARSIRGPPAG